MTRMRTLSEGRLQHGIPIALTVGESARTRPDKETPLRENEVRKKMSGRGAADESTPPPAASASLDPEDWTGLRKQAHRMLDDMLGYMETMREFPVWQVIPDEVRARFREDLPAQPTPLARGPRRVHEPQFCPSRHAMPTQVFWAGYRAAARR